MHLWNFCSVELTFELDTLNCDQKYYIEKRKFVDPTAQILIGMKSTGKRLGNKVPVMTESGMAYHVMMFINREKTSSEHRIGEEFFWESMASKKIFREKTPEELKTFFRKQFWGQFKRFGIPEKTYKILLQNIRVTYEESVDKRLEILINIFEKSSYNLDDLKNKKFWIDFFFEHTYLFDPLSVWDKNIALYKKKLEEMPQLLKRKSNTSKVVLLTSSASTTTLETSTEKMDETKVKSPLASSTELQESPTTAGSNESMEILCQGKEDEVCSSTTVTLSGEKYKEVSSTNQDLIVETTQESLIPSTSAITKECTIHHQGALAVKPEVSMEQDMSITEECQSSDTNVQSLKEGERSLEPCTEQNTIPSCSKQLKNVVELQGSKEDALKTLGLQSAMNLLAAKRNVTSLAEYNHASTFFRVLTVMAKAAEELGSSNLIMEDWHKLPDVDAKQEFVRLSSLSDISDDNKLSSLSSTFNRLCVSFGRLLQLERKLSEQRKKVTMETSLER